MGLVNVDDPDESRGSGDHYCWLIGAEFQSKVLCPFNQTIIQHLYIGTLCLVPSGRYELEWGIVDSIVKNLYREK